MSVKLNDKPCGACKYYDPILKGDSKGGLKATRRGWCAKFSVYPHTEGPGQKFPEGVKRVDNRSDLAKPKIVTEKEVVKNCSAFTQKGAVPSKADLLKTLKGKSRVR